MYRGLYSIDSISEETTTGIPPSLLGSPWKVPTFWTQWYWCGGRHRSRDGQEKSPEPKDDPGGSVL